MSTGFGQWYEEKKAAEAGESASSSNSSWFGGSETLLPLVGDSSQMMDFSSMRTSMEAAMPQKVFGMNYQQRFRMFCALLVLSALFFALGFSVGLPMVAIRPQKFALCFTFGSLTFMASFGILVGPKEHMTGMLTSARLPFTVLYFGSMLATLYFTFNVGGATGYLFVIGASGAQLVALLWYLISFLPGGSTGLSMLLSAMGRILKPLAIACAKLQAMILSRCLGIS